MPPPPFPLDIIITARPVSANRTGIRRAAWKKRVRVAYYKTYGLGPTPTFNDVVFSVGNYYGDESVIDADNAIKVTQDGLNKKVYDDDKQVTDSLGYKRSIGISSSDPAISGKVAAGIPFVRVQVSLSAAPHLTLP